MRTIPAWYVIWLLQNVGDISRQAIIIAGMSLLDMENLLFCNNDFICYQVLLYHTIKRPINFAYEIHVRVHTNLV